MTPQKSYESYGLGKPLQSWFKTQTLILQKVTFYLAHLLITPLENALTCSVVRGQMKFLKC